MHPMSKEKKTEISLTLLQSGDQAEFAKLVEQYSDFIYKLAIKMLANDQDAEDVLQETFLKAFRSINGFRGNSSLSTWLYRIATNEALMLIRKRKPENQQIDIDKEDEEEKETPLQIVDWAALPEDQLLSVESIAYLNKIVQKLTPALRIVFILRDVMDQSVRETADVLELSETAVKTRLSRARLQLRQQLSEYFGQEKIDKRVIYEKT
jgi:RNA polymerase sigma-70 factor (ECF subfamily)